MTEAEWLVCEDPKQMLMHLRDKVSDRKFRLFAVAALRRCEEFHNPLWKTPLALAERYAEQPTGEAGQMLWQACRMRGGMPAEGFEWVLGADTPYYSALIAMYWVLGDAGPVSRLQMGRRPEERLHLAELLREVFGPVPLGPAFFSPAWRTSAVRELATLPPGEHLPILGDALEEAGCTDADILSHLRSPGLHVRGCWALDLILTDCR